jgi:putative endonuclease
MVLLYKALYVYIIKCSDDTFYTGVTNSLRDRYVEHEMGLNQNAYTTKRRPFQCLYWEEWDNARLAILREKQIKKWSRKKKWALMTGDIEMLKELSLTHSTGSG